MKTPYDVLGVAPDADEQTIANAFRAAAKACHPDLNPEDGAAQQFKQISVARDALKNPEWRALYRYLQFRRQHDRRHWMITIASCTLSALLSAGLVSLLQQRSLSEPSFEDRAALVAANLDAEVAGGRRQFELAGTGRPDLAAFNKAPARPELTVEAALQEIIREQGDGRTAPKHQAGRSCDQRPNLRAAQSPQPAGERCAESSRQLPLRPGAKVPRTRPAAAASGKGPSRTLWSLLGLTAGPRPSGKSTRDTSIQAPRAAQQTRPSNALSNRCWTEEDGVHRTPCATRAGSQ
jgi:curved DNA-binding protein CbpA